MAKADDDAHTAATIDACVNAVAATAVATAVAAAHPAAAHPADAADTTNPSAARAKTASETVEEAEAEATATAQHMFACCLSEERDGQWQCNGGCGRNNGGRWFHVSCKRGGQHGDRASPLCEDCVAEAMAGGQRPKRAKV